MDTETESFVRASQKAMKHIFQIPEYQRKTFGVSKDERAASLRAIIAAANAVAVAASSVLGHLNPPPADTIHHHYPPYPPVSRDGSVAVPVLPDAGH